MTESSERPPNGRGGYSGFTLREGQHEMALHEGETVIGRSSECSVILDGALVSRRHAALRIADARVFLRDLNSRNGTSVNGQPIRGEVELKPSDLLLVGNVELQLLRRSDPLRSRFQEMRRAPTMTVEPVCAETEPAPECESATRTVTEPPEEQTRSGNALELLGSVIEKFFALGQGADARRLLAGPIDAVWEDAKRGRTVDPKLADRAAEYAVRLAEATTDDSWIVKTLDIFAAQQRPLPLPVVDRLYSFRRRLPRDGRRILEAYVQSLQERRHRLTAAERFALKRLEGLLRIASL